MWKPSLVPRPTYCFQYNAQYWKRSALGVVLGLGPRLVEAFSQVRLGLGMRLWNKCTVQSWVHVSWNNSHLISKDIVGPRHTLQQRSPHCDRASILWSSHGSLLLGAYGPTTISWLALRDESGREGMLTKWDGRWRRQIGYCGMLSISPTWGFTCSGSPFLL